MGEDEVENLRGHEWAGALFGVARYLDRLLGSKSMQAVVLII